MATLEKYYVVLDRDGRKISSFAKACDAWNLAMRTDGARVVEYVHCKAVM